MNNVILILSSRTPITLSGSNTEEIRSSICIYVGESPVTRDGFL